MTATAGIYDYVSCISRSEQCDHTSCPADARFPDSGSHPVNHEVIDLTDFWVELSRGEGITYC